MKNVMRAGGFNRRFICAAMMAVVGGAVAAYADAPTYYVSTSGNDVNDGLTPQTAWATIGKVDAASATFVPGTEVLLQRGDVWQETLMPESSGVAGAPITYSAYGDPNAAKPELLGSDVITGFTSLGNSAYAATTPSIPGAAYLNHNFLDPAEILDPSNPIAYVESTADTYYYDPTGGALYVNTGGVAINDATITATRRQNIVDSNGQSYVTFDNLQTDETAELNDGYGFDIHDGSNITVENSDAYRAGKHHFGALNTTNFVGKNLVAEYTMPDQASLGGSSAYVSYGDALGPAQQTYEWDNISASNLADGEAFITHGPSVAKVTINNLQAPGYAVSFNNDVQNGAVTMNGGVTGDIRVTAEGTVINGTQILNAVLYLQGNDALVQNVLMNGLPVADVYRGSVVITGSNNTVRFSTIADQPVTQDMSNVVLTGPLAVGTSLYGNIFATPENYVNNYTGAPLVLYSNHNLFAISPSMLLGFAPSLTGAQWQAMGFDTSSVIAAPMFANAAGGDFSLLPGSPAIGPFTGAFWQAVTSDILGNARPNGATITMGAYETAQTPGATITASADSDLGAPGAAVSINGGALQINGDSFTSTARPIELGTSGGVIDIASATNTFTLNSTVSGGTLTKLGPGTLVLAQSYSTTAVMLISQGTLELAGPANTTSDIFGAGTLQVDAGSTLVADGVAVGTLRIHGTVQIHPDGTADGTSVLNVLALDGGTGAWSTGIDITNNHLIVEDVTDHAGTLAQLKDQAAYGNTHTAGIFSSTAPAGQVVAVVDNAVFNAATFGGMNVDAGSILLVSTYNGDANLDGVVDISDLTIVANNWQQNVSDWSQGDFDGNGIVDIRDLTAIANNWQAGTTSGGAGSSDSLDLFAALRSSDATPEPGALFSLFVGLPVLLTRRRGKRA